MSKKETNWLINAQHIRSIITIKEKPLPREWLTYNDGTKANSSSGSNINIDYLHINKERYIGDVIHPILTTNIFYQYIVNNSLN